MGFCARKLELDLRASAGQGRKLAAGPNAAGTESPAWGRKSNPPGWFQSG